MVLFILKVFEFEFRVLLGEVGVPVNLRGEFLRLAVGLSFLENLKHEIGQVSFAVELEPFLGVLSHLPVVLLQNHWFLDLSAKLNCLVLFSIFKTI